MPKVANFISIGGIHIQKNGGTPLHRQLYESLRLKILSGSLPPGTRLPSTRALATELSISRNTVSNAFSQLLTEGYIESQVGSGTRVTRTLPEEILQVGLTETEAGKSHSSNNRTATINLSERGTAILKIPYDWEGPRSDAFNSALPSTLGFPAKEWERLLVAAWRELETTSLGYYPSNGYLPLREALAEHLTTVRGVRCSAENIVITSGAQQAVTITANMLLDRGDAAWVENPCYPGIQAALSGALAHIVPVPVDEEGLNVEKALAIAPKARLAYVSPSHQYPLGVTMSLTRRLQLLQWAEDNDAWIVEDDYDSEYRYTGYPIPAVQGLDSGGRVIYVGTFSKVLFPALRIGYLVLPDMLVKPFHAARAHADRGSSLLEQAVLASFIRSGDLSRHIRRMRIFYAERQALTISLIEARLGQSATVSGTHAGLHFVLSLPESVDDGAVSAELASHGIHAPPLSKFALSKLDQSGLVLGFAAVPDEQIAASVDLLCQIVQQHIENAVPKPEHSFPDTTI